MKKLILQLIRGYQKIKKFETCRFQPTCSEYSYQAIKKRGLLKGGWLGLRRVLHCHPWNQGGVDLLK